MISSDTLLARIETGDPPAILDVRSRAEFERGHVPGALHVPFGSIGERAAALPVDPEKPLVVYCGHGPRAWIAGAALRRRGFSKIVYLAGHMSSWRKRGLPTEVGG